MEISERYYVKKQDSLLQNWYFFKKATISLWKVKVKNEFITKNTVFIVILIFFYLNVFVFVDAIIITYKKCLKFLVVIAVFLNPLNLFWQLLLVEFYIIIYVIY